ncbi:MAG: DNA repair protein RadA [Sphaerochaetaceae bacterium]
MRDLKSQYICSQCGRLENKWLGRCPDCGSWNSFVEEIVKKGSSTLVRDTNKSQVVTLSEVKIDNNFRYTSEISEFDRVLGGGIMRGATVLLGGEPGIGKSTLMLQLLGSLKNLKLLYISGEESPSQVRLRAERIQIDLNSISLFTDSRLQQIEELLRREKFDVVVVDSLQTLYSEEIPSPAGSVNQMRMCAMELVSLAKREGFALFFVGHITKEGQIAGPKAIEHIVDTVLYFEQAEGGVRIVRAVKNRYGSVDEIGIFLMEERGLLSVKDPGGFFVSKRESSFLPPGIAFSVVVEGSRTFMVEIQALAVPTKGGYPRLYSERIESSRVMRVAAVLERHAKINLLDKDLYVNVAGGITLKEVAIELPLALALYSAISSKALDSKLVSIGELSLAGEVRPVSYTDKRVKGALEMGFTTIVGNQNLKGNFKEANFVTCRTIKEAVDIVRNPN